MEIFIGIILVLTITFVFWLFARMSSIAICPICAGISGTWLILLGASILGFGVDLRIPAVLMGGSVVGVAYQIEKRLPPRRSPLLFKTLFMSAGFLAAYGALYAEWLLFAAAAALAVVIVATFLRKKSGEGENVTKKQTAELEQKMKDCC